MFLKNKIILIFVFILACQPVEVIKIVDINYSKFEKISVNAKEISINVKYNPIFSEENIEDQVKNSPMELMSNWCNKNISKFGNENKFIINIIESSISKKEIDNIDAKKYEEKTIFQYEVFFLVEYELYNDSGVLLANTTVESSRSTTSRKFISINETELIINDLLNNSLENFAKESKNLLKIYMSQYLN